MCTLTGKTERANFNSLYLFLFFSRLKCQDFIDCNIVLRLDGGSVDRLNSDSDGAVHVSVAEDLDIVGADVLEDGGRS